MVVFKEIIRCLWFPTCNTTALCIFSSCVWCVGINTNVQNTNTNVQNTNTNVQNTNTIAQIQISPVNTKLNSAVVFCICFLCAKSTIGSSSRSIVHHPSIVFAILYLYLCLQFCNFVFVLYLFTTGGAG